MNPNIKVTFLMIAYNIESYIGRQMASQTTESAFMGKATVNKARSIALLRRQILHSIPEAFRNASSYGREDFIQ